MKSELGILQADHDIEGQFHQQADGSAAVAGIDAQLTPDEQVEEIHHEGGDEDQHLPRHIRQEDEKCQRQQPLEGEADTGLGTELAIDRPRLRLLFLPGIRHHDDQFGSQHLRIGVGGEDGQCRHLGRYPVQCAEEQQQVAAQAEHAVGADVGVLHDVEDALPVIAAPTESVEEVGEAVFVEGTRQQQPRHDGQDHRNGIDGMSREHATQIERGSHHPAREPARQGPVLYHRRITRLRGLVEPPEGQSGEEDEDRTDTVVPLRLVDVYFHKR